MIIYDTYFQIQLPQLELLLMGYIYIMLVMYVGTIKLLCLLGLHCSYEKRRA